MCPLSKGPAPHTQPALWDESEIEAEASSAKCAKWETIKLEGGELILIHNWLAAAKADAYFHRLNKLVQWQQSTIRIAGREIPIPRLNAWYGDAGTAYQYSGIRFNPLPWNRPLAVLKQRAQQALAVVPASSFSQTLAINSALLNLYRHGQDSVAWHADNEKELGPSPQIASVSLGEARRFLLRRLQAKGERLELTLEHGSLLLILGDIQRYWVHCVPKTRRALAPRINVTFRQVLKPSTP